VPSPAAEVVVVMLQLRSTRTQFLPADTGAPAGTNWLRYAPIIGCHREPTKSAPLPNEVHRALSIEENIFKPSKVRNCRFGRAPGGTELVLPGVR